MRKSDVLAIVCADIHLCHRPPVARSAEPDWYDAMARPLDEIGGLIHKYNCPLFIVGDIFDKWDVPPELINFAFDKIPGECGCFAIPGQHDMPNHNYQEMHRSAYNTLKKAGIFQDVTWYEGPLGVRGFRYGFGDMENVYPRDKNKKIRLALIHTYCSDYGARYKDAPEYTYVENWRHRLRNYTLAVFGDNHIPFENGKIFNCGGLYRRRFDEMSHRPRIGLVKKDGTIESYQLDCSQDKFADRDFEIDKESIDMDRFMEDLTDMRASAIEFQEIVKRFFSINPHSKGAKKVILKALEAVL